MKIEHLRKKLKERHLVEPMRQSRFKDKKIKNEYNDKLKIIGITGSKGKSSVAYILHNYLKSLGFVSVLYSSIEVDSPLSYLKSKTAVENPLINEGQLLNAIEQSIGIDADFLILEVNERAIKQGIIDDVPFDVKVLTNIIEKHNDIFYPDYVEIKKSFLKNASGNETLVLGVKDRMCKELNEELKTDKKKIYCTEFIANKYGIANDEIDFLITHNNDKFDNIDGVDFKIKKKNNEIINLKSKLLMPHNIFNLTCVMLILESLNLLNTNKYLEFIKNLSIPGRDEVVKFKDRTIIVSLSLIPHLEHLNDYKNRGEVNDIKVVVGTSGLGFKSWVKEFSDELYEKEKNESMSFAYKYIDKNADKVYITLSDVGASNVDDLLQTQKDFLINSNKIIIKNRKEAIKQALKESLPKDVIFISGRGNREIMCSSRDKMEIFKDIDVVKEIINELMEEL